MNKTAEEAAAAGAKLIAQFIADLNALMDAGPAEVRSNVALTAAASVAATVIASAPCPQCAAGQIWKALAMRGLLPHEIEAHAASGGTSHAVH